VELEEVEKTPNKIVIEDWPRDEWQAASAKHHTSGSQFWHPALRASKCYFSYTCDLSEWLILLKTLYSFMCPFGRE
jgi:hypothetical protein